MCPRSPSPARQSSGLPTPWPEWPQRALCTRGQLPGQRADWTACPHPEMLNLSLEWKMLYCLHGPWTLLEWPTAETLDPYNSRSWFLASVTVLVECPGQPAMVSGWELCAGCSMARQECHSWPELSDRRTRVYKLRSGIAYRAQVPWQRHSHMAAPDCKRGCEMSS